MKWHDYTLCWPPMAAAHGCSSIKALAYLFQRALRENEKLFGPARISFINTIAHFQAEANWQNEKRPYYDVWPSVVEAFTKIDLGKLTCDQVRLPLPTLLIRFQQGHELRFGESKARAVFAAQTFAKDKQDVPGLLVGVDDGKFDEGGLPNHQLTCIVLQPGTTIMSRLERSRDNSHRPESSDLNDGLMEQAYRLVVAMCLLKDNPDLIEPEPIEADRAKWEAAHGDVAKRAELLDKAARRGKRCWSVGKHIEVAPGFRRPHFAIRWCGKGGTDPRLRPIKGCLVRRQKIEEVPTGYLDVPVNAIVLDEEEHQPA